MYGMRNEERREREREERKRNRAWRGGCWFNKFVLENELMNKEIRV